MGDISAGEGRTILFVSHNMGAIRTLCKSGIFLANGTMQGYGEIDQIVNQYMKSAVSHLNSFDEPNVKRTGSGKMRIQAACILNDKGEEANEFFVGDELRFKLDLDNPEQVLQSAIGIQVKGMDDMPLLHMMNKDSGFVLQHQQRFESYLIQIPAIPLFPGDYKVTLTIADPSGFDVYDNIEACLEFTILQGGKHVTRRLPREAGIFFLSPHWQKLS